MKKSNKESTEWLDHLHWQKQTVSPISFASILPETFFELLASTFESLSPLGQAIGKILFGVVEHCKMGFIAGQLKIHLHRASTRHNYCYFICNI